jgi:hypothetical protein
MDELEAHFVSNILSADWYDAAQNRIPPCGVDEALAFAHAVVDTLRKSAPTPEAFLINLAALAGGKILMEKGSLRITRFEDLPDRTRYTAAYQLRFGDIVGSWAMEETVMHDKWKKPTTRDEGADVSGPGSAAAPPNGTGGPRREEHWERKYKEVADMLKQRDEEMLRLKSKILESVRDY